MTNKQFEDFLSWKDNYLRYAPKNHISMEEVYAAYADSVASGLKIGDKGSPPLKPKTFARLLKKAFESLPDDGFVVFYYKDRSLISGLALSKPILNTSA